MKKLLFKRILIAFCLGVVFLSVPFIGVLAEACSAPGACVASGQCSTGDSTKSVISGDCADPAKPVCCKTSGVDFDAEIVNTGLSTNFTGIVGNVGAYVLSFVAIVIVIIIIIGGITWMTAQGNEQKIASGRKMVIGAIIGMAIILIAGGIYALVFRAVSGTPINGDDPSGGQGGQCQGGCYCDEQQCDEFVGFMGDCVCGDDFGICPIEGDVCCVEIGL